MQLIYVDTIDPFGSYLKIWQGDKITFDPGLIIP